MHKIQDCQPRDEANSLPTNDIYLNGENLKSSIKLLRIQDCQPRDEANSLFLLVDLYFSFDPSLSMLNVI